MPWRCTPTPPNQCPYKVSTSYTLQFPRYSPDKILEVKVTTPRAKVKSRSHHDVAHLHPLTNVPTKYQLPTPYCFQDIARTRFSNTRSLWQGQIKVTPRRCTPTPPNQCPYQVSTSYTFWDTAWTNFFPPPARPPAHPDTMGENNTPTALKGCGVKKW